MSLSALLESLKASPSVEIVVIERDACVEIDTLQAEVAALREVAASQAAFINAAATQLIAQRRSYDALASATRHLLDVLYPTIATGQTLPAERKEAARVAVQIEQILAARKHQQ